MRISRFLLALLAATLLLVAMPAISRAAFFWSGDLDPSDPTTWTENINGCIGKSSNGVLTVNNGSGLKSNEGYIGYASSATGVVNIYGAGSAWSASSDLYIGRSGKGTLNITDGGAVSSRSGYIGTYSGSTGVATVDGVGSIWSTNTLRVANNGKGTLNISNGGAVNVVGTTTVGDVATALGAINFGPGGGTLTTGMLVANPSRLTGTGTIIAHGIYCNFDLLFDSTESLSQTFTLNSLPDQNIAVTLDLANNPANNGDLGIGWKGNGSLAIENGVSVQSRAGYIAYDSGSNCTAVVNGTDSTWANTSHLYVGYSGNATLNITDGGRVSNNTGYIAFYSGSTDEVAVSGAGSTWTNASDLYIGRSGNGTLNIFDGGTVAVSGTTYVGLNADSTGKIDFKAGGGVLTTRTLVAQANQLTGIGSIVAQGLMSDFDVVFDSTTGSSPKITLNSQPGQNIEITLSMPYGSGKLGNVSVGYKKHGSLVVRDGISIQTKPPPPARRWV